jgi:DNA polymerase elongation subunit (family B)
MSKVEIEKLITARQKGETWESLSNKFKGHTPNALRKTFYRNIKKPHLKVLLFDIETAPILGYVWGLFDQNIGLNQINSDWHVLSWSAKWLYDAPEKVMYADQRKAKNIEDDSKILQGIWKLLDEADVVITQNGIKFDVKKLNARFIQHGFPPPSSFRHIDTLRIAKKHFAFTSNKLEYMTDKLCIKYKKLKHAKFSGFELWKACLAGNLEAWKEMEMYNKYDVLSLEELYTVLQPWDNSINFNIFHTDLETRCNCGSTEFSKKGYKYTNTGKFHRLVCNSCGAEYFDKTNLLSKEKSKSLKAVLDIDLLSDFEELFDLD